MEETTVKPLYLRLNEKRTVFGNDEIEKHYTSLAVNNLAPLAEALERLLDNPTPNIGDADFMAKLEKHTKASRTAKEALAEIS